MDNYDGLSAADKVYTDATPDDIDSLPPSAPHRDVDLVIRSFTQRCLPGRGDLEHKARVAIIAPPLIYGTGTGPTNRFSIQIPTWTEISLRLGKVVIPGKGAAVWNTVLVRLSGALTDDRPTETDFGLPRATGD